MLCPSPCFQATAVESAASCGLDGTDQEGGGAGDAPDGAAADWSGPVDSCPFEPFLEGIATGRRSTAAVTSARLNTATSECTSTADGLGDRTTPASGTSIDPFVDAVVMCIQAQSATIGSESKRCAMTF
eukprot:GHVU01070157.1.p5 GENE.GHVU01070157.1~~GHVU01070157.1.p5  ORF type:complete len:129 (-),score=17.11 GHVU01070157.1:94-480(-)